MAILLRTLPLALALPAISAGGAGSQPVSYPEAADALPWAADRTYADLVRLVAPASAAGNEAGAPGIDIRHIDGSDMARLAPSATRLSRIAALPVR